VEEKRPFRIGHVPCWTDVLTVNSSQFTVDSAASGRNQIDVEDADDAVAPGFALQGFHCFGAGGRAVAGPRLPYGSLRDEAAATAWPWRQQGGASPPCHPALTIDPSASLQPITAAMIRQNRVLPQRLLRFDIRGVARTAKPRSGEASHLYCQLSTVDCRLDRFISIFRNCTAHRFSQ